MKHVHAEAIKAWADGSEIEIWCIHRWFHISHPSWREDELYRIKPTPKPDEVRYGIARVLGGGYAEVQYLGTSNGRKENNIKLTFDGETGKLKAAEVLK